MSIWLWTHKQLLYSHLYLGLMWELNIYKMPSTILGTKHSHFIGQLPFFPNFWTHPFIYLFACFTVSYSFYSISRVHRAVFIRFFFLLNNHCFTMLCYFQVNYFLATAGKKKKFFLLIVIWALCRGEWSFGALGWELVLYKVNAVQISYCTNSPELKCKFCYLCNFKPVISVLCAAFSLWVKYGQYLLFTVVPSSKQFMHFVMPDDKVAWLVSL